MTDSLIERANELRERLVELRRQNERAQVELTDVVVQLAAEGRTLREVGELVGLSHQRVHQILEPRGGSKLTRLPRRGRRPRARTALARLSASARVALGIAQEEATALRHNFIGTEHLLLGLLRTDPQLSAELAPRLDVADVRSAIIDNVGFGKVELKGPTKRMLPRMKLALAAAVRETDRLGESELSPRALLAGIAAVEDSVGAQILRERGIELEDIVPR